jgi:hypothetical protein
MHSVLFSILDFTVKSGQKITLLLSRDISEVNTLYKINFNKTSTNMYEKHADYGYRLTRMYPSFPKAGNS